MKARLNLTINEDLLSKVKVYAERKQSSVSQLVEEYFKTLTNELKKKSLLDIIEELPKPTMDFPPDFDYKKEYYEQKRKKYGF
jgi:hypothetical protein